MLQSALVAGAVWGCAAGLLEATARLAGIGPVTPMAHACLGTAVGAYVLLYDRKEYLDGTSSLLLAVDEKTYLAIHGMFTLESVPFAAVQQAWEQGLVRVHPEFRRRIVRRRWLCSFFDKSHQYDPAHHYRHHPERATRHEIERALSSAVTESPLDPAHPLWELHVWDNFADAEDGGKTRTFCCLRIHHALCDGISLARVLLTAFERHDPKAVLPQSSSSSSSTASASASASASAPAAAGSKKKKKPSAGALAAVKQTVGTLYKILLQPTDPASVFKAESAVSPAAGHKLSVAMRRCDYSVEELKAIAKAHGATLNDLLVSAWAGAMMRYQDAFGTPENRCEDVQAVVWVSFNPSSDINKTAAEKPLEWGNSNLGCVTIVLPLHITDPLERLREVRARIQALLGSPEPVVGAVTMRLFSWLPEPILKLAWAAVSQKVTISLSNMPGPQVPMSFAGRSVRDLFFFVPASGRTCMFSCLLTFDGRQTVCVATDKRVGTQNQVDSMVEEFFQNELHDMANDLKKQKLKMK